MKERYIDTIKPLDIFQKRESKYGKSEIWSTDDLLQGEENERAKERINDLYWDIIDRQEEKQAKQNLSSTTL